MWGALSDERIGLSFTIATAPLQRGHSRVRVPSPVGLVTVFYCLRFETSLFVASYNLQGCGGDIRPRLHTGLAFTDLYSSSYRNINFSVYVQKMLEALFVIA
jgi:hypothetical protein